MMIRTYSELKMLTSFEERFRYLSLQGQVGEATFGFDRWMNQEFYRSREWRNVRQDVIARDEGCDLAVPGYEIYANLYIHHMNPMTADQIKFADDAILNPENLITVSMRTHNAIHYGDESQLTKAHVPRAYGDTKLW